MPESRANPTSCPARLLERIAPLHARSGGVKQEAFRLPRLSRTVCIYPIGTGSESPRPTAADAVMIRLGGTASGRTVWDDLVFTHISARVPGPEHHFLINPYGMMFEEITASSLVKVDADGNALGNSPYAVNPAGFTIHSAVHEVREDAGCVICIRPTAPRWRPHRPVCCRSIRPRRSFFRTSPITTMRASRSTWMSGRGFNAT